MVVVAVLLVGVEGAGWWNGGSPWATRQGENEALNGVLNEVLNGVGCGVVFEVFFGVVLE